MATIKNFALNEVVCVYDAANAVHVSVKGPGKVDINPPGAADHVTLHNPGHPKNGWKVGEFAWLATFGDTTAMTNYGDTFWKFPDGTLTRDLTVPNVRLDDGNGHTHNYEYHLHLAFNWDGEPGIDKLITKGLFDPTPYLVGAARADLKTAPNVTATEPQPPDNWKQLVKVADDFGIHIDPKNILIVSHISDEDKAGHLFFNELLKDTARLKKQLLIAEMHLAISGKANEQWAANAERIVKVKTDYMWAMNAIGKASGGRDRSHSRVAACCCCSVASKVSASIWGSGEGDVGGSADILLDQDITGKRGGKIDLSQEGKIEGGGKIDEELDFFEPSSSPPASKSGPLKLGPIKVPSPPLNKVGVPAPAAGGVPTPADGIFHVPIGAVESAAGAGAKLDLTFKNGEVTAIFVDKGGKGYVAGNTLTIKKASYAGVMDVIITLSPDNIDA